MTAGESLAIAALRGEWRSHLAGGFGCPQMDLYDPVDLALAAWTEDGRRRRLQVAPDAREEEGPDLNPGSYVKTTGGILQIIGSRSIVAIQKHPKSVAPSPASRQG
jgi:hypothetical protein